VSTEELASKTGLYRLGPDENHVVSMSVRDGRLTAWDFWGDNYPMQMTQVGPNRFSLPGATLEFSPAEAERPRAWYLIDGEGKRTIELPSVEFDIAEANLRSLAGAYRSEELGVTYTVAVRDSHLTIQGSMLQPVYQDAFVGEYLGMVRFFRDARGSVLGFTLNRDLARGVRFERAKTG